MMESDGLRLRIKRINGNIYVQKNVCVKIHRRIKVYEWRGVDSDGHYFSSSSIGSSYCPGTIPKKFKSKKAAKKFIRKITHPERDKVLEEYWFPGIKS